MIAIGDGAGADDGSGNEVAGGSRVGHQLMESEVHLAAVGIAGNLTFIVLALTQMLGVGTTTVVSHAAGRRNHEEALLLFNRGNQPVSIRATDEQLGVPANFKAKVRDLWGHKELKRWSGAIEAVVQPHDVQMYRIQP